MRPRLHCLSLALCGTLFAGCSHKDPDIAQRPDHTPYSKSAYTAGRADAERDLQAGRLVVEDFGFPRKGQEEYAGILQRRYHIEVRHVAGDIVDLKAYGHAYGYNDVSKPEIKRRFNDDVLEKAETEAAQHYDATTKK